MAENQELSELAFGLKFVVDRAYFRYRWDTFCYNLVHESRFIPNNEDKRFIEGVTNLIIKYFTVELPVGCSFYRARIIPGMDLSVQKYIDEINTERGKFSTWIARKSSIRGYSKLSEVGIPPMDKAVSNRASPKGILYLYVADNIYTAVSEVRPSILDVVNVVEFTNETPLKIVKIPRTLNEIKEILTHRNAETKMERYLIEIANFLAFTFSRPIRSGDTDFEYLPTQYLVNAIRASDQSIQGIAYPSFQSHVGTNYVFFRQDDLTLQNQPEKIIRVQNVTYDCCSLNDLTEVINPSQVDYNPILTEENVDEMKKQIVRAHENYNLPPIS